MVWQYAKIHTLLLCFPRRKIEFAILPYAIDIRLPPGKRLHRQQAMEMREPYAIDIRLPPGKRFHRQQATAAPTLATRGTTICRIVLDDLLFLKARRQGRREDVKWHGCALVVGNEKHGPISTYLHRQ
jgi:hypothetical protein